MFSVTIEQNRMFHFLLHSSKLFQKKIMLFENIVIENNKIIKILLFQMKYLVTNTSSSSFPSKIGENQPKKSKIQNSKELKKDFRNNKTIVYSKKNHKNHTSFTSSPNDVTSWKIHPSTIKGGTPELEMQSTQQ